MDTQKFKKLAGITESVQIDSVILKIANKHFNISNLSTRGNDSLDFHDVSIGSIKAALEEAYSEGYKDGYNQAPKKR